MPQRNKNRFSVDCGFVWIAHYPATKPGSCKEQFLHWTSGLSTDLTTPASPCKCQVKESPKDLEAKEDSSATPPCSITIRRAI